MLEVVADLHSYGRSDPCEAVDHGADQRPVSQPLLLFNREGDCLAAKLRPGNVHSADGWEELLLPEIDPQQAQGKEVAFRGDAAFAKPELYEALEERDVRYAIRLPANDNLQRNIEGVVDAASGTAELQAGGVVQEFSLSGGELDDSPAGGGEGRVPLRRIVPPAWALS